VACTPVGCVILAKDALGKLDGLEAVVIGRSNIVGKPVAQLLLRRTAPSPSRIRAPAICRGVPPRRPRDRRRRPAEMVTGRLDQARRLRHRCRHQPHRGRRQGRSSATSTSPVR
jgi:hypothetical protein